MSIDFNLSNSDYHNLDSLSASGAKTIASQGLRTFRYKRNKTTPAMTMGTCVHSMTFEADKGEVLRGPESRRGSEWKEMLELAERDDKILLTASDYDAAAEIADAVLSNKYAAEHINASSAVAEASIMVDDPTHNVPLRTRPDLWVTDEDIIVDLKTCLDSSPDAFAKTVSNFGYHTQNAFYKHVLGVEGHDLREFIFVAVNKEYPYNCGIYTLDEDTLSEGMAACNYAIEQYAMAKARDAWPSGYEQPQTLTLPRWGYKFSNPAIEF